MDALTADFDNEYNEMSIGLDPNHRFVYTEFMNNNERQALGLNSTTQTVIIIDTATHYFNASKLYTSLSTND